MCLFKWPLLNFTEYSNDLFCSSAKPGHCPAVDIHHVGFCASECSSDRDCQGNKKCCSNGCGRICSAPVRQGQYRQFYLTAPFDASQTVCFLLQHFKLILLCSTSGDSGLEVDPEIKLCVLIIKYFEILGKA